MACPQHRSRFRPSARGPTSRAKSLYDARMRRTRAPSRWMRFTLALALALGLAVASGAAQRSTILTNGRNLQIPINHGLPDKPLGVTFCRPHARLPAEGRLSLDRRQLGSGLRVHPSECHANPTRRKDRRPAGRAPDVLDSLSGQPAPADPVARLVGT